MSTLLPAISSEKGVPTASVPATGQLPPKRSRIQLSCTHCRHAKLKCDRKLPCSPCVKRGRADKCAFLPATTRKRPAESMQNRIRHLENLVKDAMNSQTTDNGKNDLDYPKVNGVRSDIVKPIQPQVPSHAPISVPQPSMTTESLGQVVQGVKETTYVGATHWAAILEDIEEVKSYFDETEPEDETVHESGESNIALLFNFEAHTTKEGLLAALPPQRIVDKLLYRAFKSNSSTQYIIHKPTFQKEYGKFWTNPSGTPLSWLAYLYALMTLGAMAYLWGEQECPEPHQTPAEMIRIYRSCCVQCLVLSNYTQPGPHTIEAFIMYMESEFLLSKDDKFHCFLLLGAVVRLALRVGLHRDPSKMGGTFTPFQAEMRRRIWHVLFQIDLLAAFHLGLPSMIQAVDSDTEYPRNIKDEDFYEDIPELPLGRPEADPTPILYLIAKSRICYVFARIAAHVNSLRLLAYDETMKLDKQLNEAFAKLPPHLCYVPLGLAIIDSSEVIMQRFNIALIYYKSLCVLHRKYLIQEREQHEYAYSEKVGLDASMEILSCQSAIYEAIQPGGPLAHDKWYISSLPMHDFLLAAAIVSILVVKMIQESAEDQNDQNPSYGTKQEIISALERSYNIWSELRDMSLDTKKALAFVGFMLRKIKLAIHSITRFDRTLTADFNGIEAVEEGESLILGLSMNDSIPLAEGQTATNNLSWPTGTPEAILPYTLNMSQESEWMQMPMENFDSMLDMTTDLDWEAFDSHIRQKPQLSDLASAESIFDGV